jgi:ankyrin repeat protein
MDYQKQLNAAIRENNTNALNSLLQHCDSFNESIFGPATDRNNVDALNLLLQNIKLSVKNIFKLLLIAVNYNNYETTKFLLNNYEIVNMQNKQGLTPLMAASRFGHINIAELLLGDSKINVNLQDEEGNTALMLAFQFGGMGYSNNDIIGKLLSDSRVNINLKNNHGYTALMYACMNSSVAEIKLILCNNHVNVNLQDNYGNTALMSACFHDTLDDVVFFFNCWRMVGAISTYKITTGILV